MFITRWSVVAWVLAGMACWTSNAQSAPRLDSLQVSWIKRGTTNDLVVTGDDLTAITDVRFPESKGIHASLLKSPEPPVHLEGSNGGLKSAALTDPKKATLRVIVEPTAALGAHSFRVVSASGYSNPLTVQVSDLTEQVEARSGAAMAQAPELSLPSAVSGVISANTEVDFYRFKARMGQKVVVDVQANRTGSPLDGSLVILNSAGKELARNEDGNGLDPWLEFSAPADGEYWIRLEDLRFQGGGDYRYRMVVGTIPYLETLFPFGGRRGTEVEVELTGRNLENSRRLRLQIAAEAPGGRQEVRAQTSAGVSNPLPFVIGDAPEIRESEGNNTRETANALEVPMVSNGRIGEAKDVDWYRVKPGRDVKASFSVVAREFGSPLDAILVLTDSKGGVLQQNDDANGPDARLEADLKKGEEYFVSIRDLTDRGGVRFGYRLQASAVEPKPDFGLRVSTERIRVWRGGSAAVRVEVDRRNGFSGVVKAGFSGLPTGVSGTSWVFSPEGPAFGWIILTAAKNASMAHFDVAVNGEAEVTGRRAVRVAEPRRIYLTVLGEAPFTVDSLGMAAQADQNGTAKLDVVVDRGERFDGDVVVQAEDLPGVGVGAVTIPKGQTRGTLALNIANNSEASTRPLMVRGTAKVGGVDVMQHASHWIPVTTTPIPFHLVASLPRISATALPRAMNSPAATAELVVRVDRRMGYTNEIPLMVEGLPEGVEATLPPLAVNGKESLLRLVTTEKAPAGKEFQFSVVGVGTLNDRTYRQRTASVKLVIAAPEKELAGATNAPAVKP